MIGIHFTESSRLSDSSALISEAISHDLPACIMLFTAHGNDYAPRDLTTTLKTCPVTVFGASYPGLINKGKMHLTGAIVVTFDCPAYTRVFDLGNLEDSDLTDKHFGNELNQSKSSLATIIIADTFCVALDSLLECFFENWGGRSACLGAAAGTSQTAQQNAVYSSDGAQSNAAIMVMMPTALKTGSSHGFRSRSRTVRVTAARGDVIKSLDTRPAAEVYAELVSEFAGITVTEHTLHHIAPAFPLGVTVLGRKPLLRDVVAVTEDGGLRVLSRVEVGIFLRVFSFEPRDLIEASRMNIANLGSVRNSTKDVGIVFECISRREVLGDDFEGELQVIAEGQRLVGGITGGELEFSGAGYPEFLNKTLTIGYLSACSPTEEGLGG